MEVPQGLLKIGEFAKLAGTNLRTLRYYEEIGLLRPASRSRGGFRYYRPEDFNRLVMIRELQELGLHLERIRDLMATRNSDSHREHWVEQVRGALKEQEQLLSGRIRVLQAQRRKISEALEKVHECERCNRRPLEQNNYCDPCGVTGERLPSTVSALF